MATTANRNKLREVRHQKRISLVQAAHETRISRHVLRAIELDEPTGLGASYEDGIILSYQRYLGIAPSSNSPRRKRRSKKPLRFHQNQVMATADVIKRAALLLFILMVVLYVLWQSWQLIRPPYLKIDEPRGDIITTEASVYVKGKTAADATLYLNDRVVLIEQNGSFSVKVPLRKGVNEISLTSINSFGRRAEVNRSIVYSPEN